jgi:hypothetical protein
VEVLSVQPTTLIRDAVMATNHHHLLSASTDNRPETNIALVASENARSNLRPVAAASSRHKSRGTNYTSAETNALLNLIDITLPIHGLFFIFHSLLYYYIIKLTSYLFYFIPVRQVQNGT